MRTTPVVPQYVKSVLTYTTRRKRKQRKRPRIMKSTLLGNDLPPFLFGTTRTKLLKERKVDPILKSVNTWETISSL